MARMTKRLQPNNVIVYKFGKYEDTIAAEMETSDVRTVLKALADYEDLEEQCIEENQCGLRELLLKWKEFFDDIAELYDYRKAEEQGLLLRLPCKVGDTVYKLWYKPCHNGEDCPDSYSCCGCEDECDLKKDIFEITVPNLDWILQHMKHFGDGVWFLTREEAESALAEKGGAE